MIDILKKITDLRIERNWTEYQLAEKSDIPQSTISSWYRKNFLPTIPSLYKICEAFNITLSDFFNEDTKMTSLTQSQSELLKSCNKLNKSQQQKLIDFIHTL